MRSAEVAHRGGYGEVELAALTNGLEAAIETGRWDRADEIIADLHSRAEVTGSLLDTVLLGEVLLEAYRGHPEGARAALADVSTQTLDSSNHQMRAWLARMRAVADLMAGDLDAAFAGALSAIEADPNGPNAPLAVANARQAALWKRDTDGLRRVLEATHGPSGFRVEAVAREARGVEAGLAALEGRGQEAAGIYDALLANRISVGDRFAHAVLTVEASSVLPEDLVPEGALEAARTYLSELGATPLLARLDAPVAVPQ